LGDASYIEGGRVGPPKTRREVDEIRPRRLLRCGVLDIWEQKGRRGVRE